MEWLQNNYQWIFGGIGVAAVGWLIHFFSKKPKNKGGIEQSVGKGAKTKGPQTFENINQTVNTEEEKTKK